MHCRSVLGADLVGHLDWGQFALGDNRDLSHVAHGEAFQVNRSPHFYAGRVLKVGAKYDFAGKDTTRAAGHEEDECRQGGQRHEDQHAHF